MTKLITTLVIVLFTWICTAQTTSSSSSSSSSTSSYSISISSDDGYSNNSSVSIKNSDDILRLKATFHKSKNLKIKEVLLDRLGKDNLKIKGNTFIWKNNNTDDVFECKLSEGKLFLLVDKHLVADHFLKNINTLMEDLKFVISGDDSEKRKEISKDREQQNLDRAKRDLERAEKNLKRAKQKLERAKNNH